MFVTTQDATDAVMLVEELAARFEQLAERAYTDAENIRVGAGVVLVPAENQALERRAEQLEGQGEAYMKAAYLVRSTAAAALRQIASNVRADVVGLDEIREGAVDHAG